MTNTSLAKAQQGNHIRVMTDDAKPSPKQPDSATPAPEMPKEIGGPKGPEPTRYGDWEQKGRCTDF
jgi:hypothetical protein